MTDRWYIFSLERTHDEKWDAGMFAKVLSCKLSNEFEFFIYFFFSNLFIYLVFQIFDSLDVPSDSSYNGLGWWGVSSSW